MLTPGSSANQTGCTMPCAGNATQICGGPNRLSVYNYTGTPQLTPSHAEVVGEYGFEGCFTEPASGGRALSGFSFVNGTALSAQLCVARCEERGFAYAGMEYGRECYCGGGLAGASVLVPEADCKMLCVGDRYQFCGAGARLSVYKKMVV